jgi:hypothetical protein
MSKQANNNKPEMRKYLREFVNSIINKDYAVANANLTAAVKEEIKAKVSDILQENP